MHADSSAKRTCSESRSTSLCTATVRMPISLHVQIIRQAISPRLAIRILRKRRGPFITLPICNCQLAIYSFHQRHVLNRQSAIGSLKTLLLDSEEWLTVFDRLSVLDVDLDDFAGSLSLNFIHQLHSFDDADDCRGFNLAADANE